MPDRGTKIARGPGRSYDKLRSIFLSGKCLKILTGDQQAYVVVATYDSHWYLDRREYSDLVSGKKFKLLKVADVDGCRLEKLRVMTAVQIGDLRYKVVAKDDFVGSVPDYHFKLQPTGERV
jgi:hypothetical protein